MDDFFVGQLRKIIVSGESMNPMQQFGVMTTVADLLVIPFTGYIVIHGTGNSNLHPR